MPAAHLDAETVEADFRASPQLLADYLTWPRAIRREICRDVARARPVAPKRAQYGAVARWVNKRRPMSARVDSQLAALGPKVPRSGQARVNAKRNERAEFWRTVKIHVSAELEPYFRRSLHLLGKGTRVVSSRPALNFFGYELDVHIPDAPAGAVAARPVYFGDWDGEGHTPRLDSINYRFALEV